jgi:hypothetical protein
MHDIETLGDLSLLFSPWSTHQLGSRELRTITSMVFRTYICKNIHRYVARGRRDFVENSNSDTTQNSTNESRKSPLLLLLTYSNTAVGHGAVVLDVTAYCDPVYCTHCKCTVD